ncbi:hypothetical protein P3T27_006941 [Kitasatospora sp. MAA19]|uniref:hypothetical protein n=1 Tax=unclassified Kitasatospora TaxID=2633591 RepID=UPI002472F7B4|nr:hypothetical protein [Kitasatospora sp. MAA19]MDH6710192.1 hypothetical protein [Kitasatospora sp. MAA19]
MTPLHPVLATPATVLLAGYAVVSWVMLSAACHEALDGTGESALFITVLPSGLAVGTALLALLTVGAPRLPWCWAGLGVATVGIAVLNFGLVARHHAPVCAGGALMAVTATVVEVVGFAAPAPAVLTMWNPELMRAWAAIGRSTP